MWSHVHQYLASLLILILTVTGCGLKSEDNSSLEPDPELPLRLQEIQAKGKLVVGTAITRPFEYYDNEGQLIGFDVDLMNILAERLNISVEWQEMAFADLLPALAAGNVDVVIAAMYIRPDREELVDMSQPYLDTGLIMVVQSDETQIETVSDLRGRTLGVKEGSTGAAYAQRLIDDGIELKLRIYTDTLDSLDDLDAGLLNAVLNDHLNTLVYMQEHPGVRTQGEVFDPAGLGISVQSGDAELLKYINNFLDDVQESGEIRNLFNMWINPQTSNR